jgi:pimeloyl-ACP methyl ester carboxylesterase
MTRRLLLPLTLCVAVLIGGTQSMVARSLQQATATAPAVVTLATAPDKEFTADGVTIRYRDIGEGAPIIFIHGYTATLESMIGVANALPAAHRKIALDLRGFGRSSKFSDPAKFGQAMVDDVVRLMDHLKITRAHLVGHSLGALISANVVSRYPARVSSASLIAGPFWVEPQISEESKRWTTDLDTGVGLTNFVQWLFPAFSPQMATATNAGMMKSNDLGSLTASMRAIPKLAVSGLSKDVKALVIAGTADPLFATSPPFAKMSPGAQLVEVAGANHMSVLTHAESIKAITAQLAR